MAHEDWVVGGDRHTAAAERIYAAATELILSQGLDAFDVDALAAELHCSRATVYRYAGGKAQIRDAVLLRLATGIIDTVRSTVAGMTGQQRVMAAITVALDQIKSDPLRRLMLESGHAVQPGELHASPVLSHLAAELTGITDDPEAAQWIVRVVISLALWPIPDQRVEKAVLQRFIAPAFA